MIVGPSISTLELGKAVARISAACRITLQRAGGGRFGVQSKLYPVRTSFSERSAVSRPQQHERWQEDSEWDVEPVLLRGRCFFPPSPEEVVQLSTDDSGQH